MTTGIDSFTNPGEIGAMYPFQGTEVLLAIVAVVLWILWHVKQIRDENKEYEEALRLYERVGMDRAMHFGGSSRIATDEDIELVKAQAAAGAIAAPQAPESDQAPAGADRTPAGPHAAT